jgi:hypothetical protein
VEYQRIAAAWFVPVLSTDVPSFVGGCPGRVRGRVAGFVFGTLLGPEATGPVGCGVCRGVPGLCFWFPGRTDHALFGCVGCVVRGCCLRTT